MSYKPLAADAAKQGKILGTGPTISYEQMKCDEAIEAIINACGADPKVNWSGTNDMVRNGMDFVRPLTGDYMSEIKPGDLVFIKEPDESGLTGGAAKYKGDGVGDFSHVGMYIGDENAFEDVDKNGKVRLCNVVHSSSTMGRVAGSRLEKKVVSGGWNYRAQTDRLNYGGVWAEIPSIEPESPSLPLEEYIPDAPVIHVPPPANKEPAPGEAMVNTESTGLLLRKEPKDNAAVIKEMPKGHIVRVLEFYGAWTKVEFVDFRGMLHRGWCKAQYLRMG